MFVGRDACSRDRVQKKAAMFIKSNIQRNRIDPESHAKSPELIPEEMRLGFLLSGDAFTRGMMLSHIQAVVHRGA